MVTLYRPTGLERMEWYAKKASTAFTFGDMVYINASGFLDEATATSSPGIVGLIYRTVKSTDTDFAQATRVPVIVAEKNTVFLADVGTGTATQGVVGEFHDLTNSTSVDVTADTFGVVEVIDFISATQVLIKFAVKSGPAAG